VQLVAVLAVEVLLQHELAVTRDQHAMDFGRVHGLDRHVDQHLDELLDRHPVDLRLIECPGRPTVVAGGRRPVGVRLRVTAAWIESAVLVVAAKIVGAAAFRKRNRQHVVVAVVSAFEQNLFGRLPAKVAHEPHSFALVHQVRDIVEHADVAFGISDERAERPIRLLLYHQIEREGVLARHHHTLPPIGALCRQFQRRCVAESVNPRSR
jgi:hypothetical protein